MNPSNLIGMIEGIALSIAVTAVLEGIRRWRQHLYDKEMRRDYDSAREFWESEQP